MIDLLASLLIAQTPYVSTQYSEPFAPLAGGTAILSAGTCCDEARLVPIGFTFRFYDADYTHVNVGENGALYFANPCSAGCTFNESCNLQSNVCEAFRMDPEFSGMPSFQEPNRVVAAFWDDLFLDFGIPASEIRYGLRGTAPNRELVVEWRNIRHLPQIFQPDSRMNFQIRLEEGTNVIRFHYGPFTSGQSNVEWSGIIGIENANGTEAAFPIACGGTNTCSWIDLNSLNNQVFQLSIPNAPELLGNVSNPRGAAPGSPASFPVTVRNIGLQSTGIAFQAAVYLSTDQNIVPGADTLLGTVNFAALGAGTTATATLSVNTPNITQAYYNVGAVIDSSSVINEPVENNNTALSNRLFLVGRDVSASFGPHAGLEPGASAQITFDLVNESSALGSVGWQVYLSTNTVRDASDTLLASGTTAVPASTALPIVSTVTVPVVTPGVYRLIAVIDPANAIVELNEFNNEVVSGPVLVGSDLAISDITFPTTSGAGATLPLTINVFNAGAAVPLAGLEVFISTNTVLDGNDPMIYTGTVPAPFGTTPTLIDALVPTALTTGDYFLIARIDPAAVIDEVDESNNTFSTFSTIRLIGPDLASIRVDVPALAFRGESYRLRGTIDNQGGSPFYGFYAAFYLSENELITISDPVLLEVGPLDLQPGEQLEVDETIIFPTTVEPGPYFIGFVSDSREAVVEDREINNIRRTTGIVTVRDIAPDFMTSEIVAPVSAGSGESFWVQRILQNSGNDMGSADYLMFLVLEGTAVRAAVIGSGSITLGPGQLDENADLVTVPADVEPGDYRVEYVMDPEELLAELDEDNNSSMSGNPVTLQPAQLGIVSGDPTLAVIGVDYQFDFVARGGTGPLEWSITQGALPQGLALDAQSGRISGTPTEEGVSTFGLRVSDGALFHERAFAIRVISPTTELRIVTRAIPPAFVSTPYDFPLVAIGGVEPYNYAVDPALPEGLILSGEGHVNGTSSTVAAALVYTFSVTDATGAKADTLIAFRVLSRDRSVRFDQAALPDGVIGEQYDTPLAAVGGIAPYTFAVASGELPAGLTIANGRLAGVPSEAGTFIFELSVTDDAKDSDHNLYVVRIEAMDQVRFVTRSLPSGKVGQRYEQADGGPVQVRAIAPGSTSSVTFELFSGTLPDGLALDSAGGISGTPTEAGVFAFILAANDPIGETDLRAFGVVIEPKDLPKMEEEGDCSCSAVERSSPLGLLWMLVLIPFALPRFRRFGKGGRRLIALLFALAPLSAHAQSDGGVGPPPPPFDAGGPDSGIGPDASMGDGGGMAGNTPYFISEYAEPYATRTGGTQLQTFSIDDGQGTVPLPFMFRFFDQFYSSIEVGTNGYATFGLDGSNLGNQAIPDTFSPNDLIALYWDDLISPNMTWQVEGTAPARIVIIQWDNSSHFSGAGELFSFQLWLYEGLSGRFELHYGPTSGLQNGAFFDATVGFENQAGDAAYNFRSCSPFCTGPELMGLEGTVFRALQDAGEDVFATDVAPVNTNAPIRVFQGVPFDARARVTSYHMEPLGPFQYAIHLVNPTTGELLMPAVATSSAITLAPYEDREVIEPVIIPIATPPGRYQLALVVDSGDALTEPDEDNNVFVSSLELFVGERRPDFTIGAVTPSAPTANPGGTLDVALELVNAGNLEGSAAWRVVLSGNSAPSVDDVITAASTSDQLLDVGQTLLINSTIDIPADLTPGLYYVGVLIDPSNTVRELVEVNNDGASTLQVQIGQGALDVRTASLPIAYLGLPYGATLSAAGGTGEYAWSVAGGALPSGIALDAATGDLFGTPDTAGTVSVTFRVTSGTATDDATIELVVAPLDGPLTIVTRRLLPGIVGLDYPPRTEEVQRLIAVGGTGQATFTTTSSLPPGLTLDGDGYLHGVPTAAGDFYVTVQASDGSETAMREIPLTIAEPGRLTLIGEQLPSATYGEVYGHQLVATGDNPVDPPIFTVVAGALPAGMMLSGSGQLSGAATMAGDFVFNVEVREVGTGARDTATFYLTVSTDEGLTIDPGSLPVATIGKVYEVILTASGGMAPIRWVVDYSDALPRGLMEERMETEGTTKFRIYGTPEEVPEGGVIGILVKAEDAAGRSRKVAYALSVVEPQVVVTPEPEGCGCTAAEPQGTSGAWLLVFLVVGWFLRMPKIPRGFRWSLLLLLTGACDCGDGGTLTELKAKLIAPERVDFGDVGLGIESVKTMVLRNDGDAVLRIQSQTLDADLEDFRIASVVPVSIGAKQEVEVSLAFTPIQLGQSTAMLTIVADDEAGTHVITLSGTGVVPGISVEFTALPCSGVDGSLSFGRVPPGSIKSVPITLRAVGSQAVTVNAARVAENATAEFSIASLAEPTAIQPGASLELAATYQPGDIGPDTAAFIIETDAPGSRTVRIPVCGEGATPTLCAEPLDMGRVAIGSNATATMVVTNCGMDALDVTALAMSTNPPSDAALAVGELGQTLPYTLAPNATIDVPVRLTASSIGNKDGWVQVTSTSLETPNVFFPVTAEVADTCSLDIVPGRLIFPAVLVGSSDRRNVLVANSGGDPCAITRVQITSGGSVFSLRDPFAVPRDLDSGFSDILVVRYEPTLPGATDVGVLEIEAGTRVRRVDLIGNPPQSPGCQLDVQPDYINFGTVPGGDSVIRQVEIRNIGLADCNLASAEFDASTSAAFTNVATQIGILPTGQQTTAIVTYRAQPTGTDSGTLRITTSDVDSPVFEIGLFGATAPPGICVAPRDVDFGTTNNGIETFRIWNCGSQPVHLTDLTFSRPDDEFTFDAPPALPAILQPNEERTISVHYISGDDVGDSAVITVGSNDPVDPLIRVNVVAGPVIVPPSAGRYLYYWQIDSFTADQSNIVRMPLQGAPIPENFWGPRNNKPCAGCHGVAADGRYVSLIEATNFSMTIIDTQTNLVVSLPFQAPNAAYVSFRPDSNSSPPYQFVYDDGDRIHVASVNDGYIGELQGANDPSYGSKMASWGSNGMIAFARGQPGGGWGFFGPADIMLIDEAGGVPVPLNGASGTNSAHYYPAYHPNGNWIAFTESLSAQGTISAQDSTLQLVPTDQSGMVLTLPNVNCPQGTCGSSFPTWSSDGEFLSFSSNRSGGAGGWDLYISDIDPSTGAAMPPFNIIEANTPQFEHAARWSD